MAAVRGCGCCCCVTHRQGELGRAQNRSAAPSLCNMSHISLRLEIILPEQPYFYFQKAIRTTHELMRIQVVADPSCLGSRALACTAEYSNLRVATRLWWRCGNCPGYP